MRHCVPGTPPLIVLLSPVIAGHRYHHHASILYTTLGDDVVREMLQVRAPTFQRRQFEAVVVVEANVERPKREIVVAVKIIPQSF